MSTTTIKILSRWDAKIVLFECDAPEGLDSGLYTRHALEKAVQARADLAGANLAGADIAGANIAGANLARANLSGADIAGADIAGANLARAYLARANFAGADIAGANLARANLARANLAGADLAGAKVRGLKLVGARPAVQISPIGSRGAMLSAWLTESGIRLQTGCFFGSVAEFEAGCAATHGDNEHAAEYKAALQLVEAHARIWTPAAEAAKEAA